MEKKSIVSNEKVVVNTNVNTPRKIKRHYNPNIFLSILLKAIIDKKNQLNVLKLTLTDIESNIESIQAEMKEYGEEVPYDMSCVFSAYVQDYHDKKEQIHEVERELDNLLSKCPLPQTQIPLSGSLEDIGGN